MKTSGVLNWKIKKKFFKIFITSLFLVITLTLVYSFSPLVFAWVNPTVAPPGGNVNLSDCSEHIDLGCDCFPEDLPVGWYECAKKEIGENCGGGKVAYLDGSGGGLIAHPTDNSTNFQWGCWGQSVGTTSQDVGTGLANTNTIVNFHEGWTSPYSTLANAGAGDCSSNNNGTVAAKLCADLSSGGYDDWYLPSKWELSHLVMHKVALGSLTWYYLSSSEFSTTNAWCYNFFAEASLACHKHVGYSVRCVRSF